MKELKIENIRDFDLTDTFECGQCFRWSREEGGSYTGVVLDYPANIVYDDGRGELTITSDFAAEGSWRKYLDLNRDYSKIKTSLSKSDEVMKKAISYAPGIRILNQDKWETLISFIISQNNNITRIKGCVEALCGNFGRDLGKFRGQNRYAFPAINELAAAMPDEYDNCRLGYRARYIAQTARLIARDDGMKLSMGGNMEAEEAREYLLSLPGVGPKVADCILLFSMQKTEAFPVDVWVARVMHELYGFDEEDHAGMKRYAQEHFSPYGGFAQQYLFHYIRQRDKDGKKNTGDDNQ